MREVEITWFNTSDDEFDIESVIHAVENGFKVKVGGFFNDNGSYQFLAKEQININFEDNYGYYIDDDEATAHELTEWEYDPDEAIGELILSTSGAYYNNKLELSGIGVTLVWN